MTITFAIAVFIAVLVCVILSFEPLDGEQPADERHATRLYRKD